MSQLAASREAPAFYSVAQAAQLFGLSEMTLYRAINEGEFPALRVRGRVVIPVRAIAEMTDAAVDGGTLVDAATWHRAREAGDVPGDGTP